MGVDAWCAFARQRNRLWAVGDCTRKLLSLAAHIVVSIMEVSPTDCGVASTNRPAGSVPPGDAEP